MHLRPGTTFFGLDLPQVLGKPLGNPEMPMLVTFNLSGSRRFIGSALLNLAWLLLLGQLSISGGAVETNLANSRLTLAVLGFENRTPSLQAGHWGVSLAWLLERSLNSLSGLRLLSPSSVQLAQRRLGLEPGSSLTPSQAQAIGERLEARRVVWGFYDLKQDQCQLSIFLLNTASGQSSQAFKATGSNWFDLRDRILSQLLAELEVQPSVEELAKMSARPTSSLAAWDNFSQALASRQQVSPGNKVETWLRQALQRDPQFMEAHLLLGFYLKDQGQLQLAEECFQRAAQIKPSSAEAHLGLGMLAVRQEHLTEAGDFLRQAALLECSTVDGKARFGELCWRQGKSQEAIETWNRAEQADPFNPLVHALLGEAHARSGQGEKARLELQDAQRFAGHQVEIELILFRAYDYLKDVPEAFEHGYKALALARKQGGFPEMIPALEKRLKQIRGALVPRSVKATMPKEHAADDLERILSQRLTPEELPLVVNPLAGSPAMKQIARTETRGAKDDLAKAKSLFTALARHVDTGPGGSLTAGEVFAAWNNPQASFRCQEYARFFVALAREIGLHAFFTLVSKDAHGKPVSHACAAVFIQDQAWLVDPAYHQFGIAHQEFSVLDDLQAVVAHLHQQAGDLPRMRIAVKLQPESPVAQINLAMTLMGQRQLEEARLVLKTASSLDPNTWQAQCALGCFAATTGHWPQAQEHLQKALVLNPHYSQTKYLLAQVLFKQGHLKSARSEFRNYLRHELEPDAIFIPAARHAIAQINETLNGD